MTVRTKYNPPPVGRLVFYSDVNFEEHLPLGHVKFYDDFVGAGAVTMPTQGAPTAGYPWVKRIVGTGPTAAGVANASCGIVGLALSSGNEKQEASLYQNDQLNFDLTKNLSFECGIMLNVLPSAAGVQFVAGLSSAWIDGPDNATEYVEFGSTANGAINIRCQDGITQTSVSSGVTFVAAGFHILRIDFSLLPQVNFYIDGAGVGSANFAGTGAATILQPYFSVYKPSGVGVATLDVDFCRVTTGR